jgi:Domain of unknown function (DUF4145)
VKSTTVYSQRIVCKAHCLNCGKDRNADLLFDHQENWGVETVFGSVRYQTLKCAGCDAIIFRKISVNSEDTDYFHDEAGDAQSVPNETIDYFPPTNSWNTPEWIDTIDDNTLSDLMHSLYIALNSKLYVLAAIGVRTAWDRATELVGIDVNKTFEVKLDELESKGDIGKKEHLLLKELIDAGSAAAHRGWKPTEKQLAVLVDLLESFLNRTFIIPNKYGKDLKGKVPKKTKSEVKAK